MAVPLIRMGRDEAHTLGKYIQSVLSNSPLVGKGSQGGLLRRMDY